MGQPTRSGSSCSATPASKRQACIRRPGRLGGLYVGFILQAMGTDFYPRLTAVSKDNAECNRLVNEQAQISLLLAGPGVIATLTLAPLVIALFYSPAFQTAVTLLRWICLGMTLRVDRLAHGIYRGGEGRAADLLLDRGGCDDGPCGPRVVACLAVRSRWLWCGVFRICMSGMDFLIYAIVRQLTGFRWSLANRKLGMMFLS